MRKKPLFITAFALLIASSTAQADYYNSFGARTVESPNGFYEQTDSCRAASQTAAPVAAAYLAGAPDRETLEGDELEASVKQAEANHQMESIELALIKAYSYDLDEFSSHESFSEQFYQDCLEEK
ncbi:hypothetical protein [Vreelandella sp. EE27]